MLLHSKIAPAHWFHSLIPQGYCYWTVYVRSFASLFFWFIQYWNFLRLYKIYIWIMQTIGILLVVESRLLLICPWCRWYISSSVPIQLKFQTCYMVQSYDDALYLVRPLFYQAQCYILSDSSCPWHHAEGSLFQLMAPNWRSRNWTWNFLLMQSKCSTN